jgi:hypothetical protein
MASVIQTKGINLGNGLLSSEIGLGGQDFLDTLHKEYFENASTERDLVKSRSCGKSQQLYGRHILKPSIL